MSKKSRMESLRGEQQKLLDERERLEKRLQAGDREVLPRIKEINGRLAELADTIAEIGDQATAQFGLYDHYEDLANDPRFAMVGAKYIKAEAASLRRVKAMFDVMIKDGTDISIKAMDDMLRDMGNGKTGSLKDKSGSAGDELFGEDPMKGF